MSLGLVSVLLILFVVIGAIATKRVEICLFFYCGLIIPKSRFNILTIRGGNLSTANNIRSKEFARVAWRKRIWP